MKDLEKLLMKKKETGKMSEEEAQAKMDVLSELLEMGSRVKNGMDSLKKVSVISDDKEGLEKGLEKAQELVEKPEMEEMLESEEHEKSESPEMEAKEESLKSMIADDEDEDSIFNLKAKMKKDEE